MIKVLLPGHGLCTLCCLRMDAFNVSSIIDYGLQLDDGVMFLVPPHGYQHFRDASMVPSTSNNWRSRYHILI
ncbi:hypothetical protein RSAG8_10434, partial [Rhizoctonia solani AG-8 WAC10335]